MRTVMHKHEIDDVLIGMRTAPHCPITNLASGGGFPLYLTIIRLLYLEVDVSKKTIHSNPTNLFHSGCESGPSSVPIPRPTNDKPVNCTLNPWIWPKMIGNASNVRYIVPKINEVLHKTYEY
jgi:hypothetical protein